MPPLENPFLNAQTGVDRLRRFAPLIFVDIHAEAAFEKTAVTRMLDGESAPWAALYNLSYCCAFVLCRICVRPVPQA